MYRLEEPAAWTEKKTPRTENISYGESEAIILSRTLILAFFLQKVSVYKSISFEFTGSRVFLSILHKADCNFVRIVAASRESG